MAAHISPAEDYNRNFETDIHDCISFAIENHGTTMLRVSFDKGASWARIKPDSVREFEAGVGNVFQGQDLQGKFGEVYTWPGETTPAAKNDVTVMKVLFKCNLSKIVQ